MDYLHQKYERGGVFICQIFRALWLAIHSIRRSMLRSLLTCCAVMLAVTSLTIIVATMEGAERKAQEIAAYFGPTAVNIMSGDATGQSLGKNTLTLTWDDVHTLRENIPGVTKVAPFLYSMGVIVSGNGKSHAADSLGGTEEEHGKTWSWPVVKGRDFTTDDVTNARTVCFLGSITAEKLFDTKNPLGERVSVLGVPFTVIGILKPTGIASDGIEIDDRVVMPITTMMRRFDFSPQHLFQIRVSFAPGSALENMPHHVETVRSVMRANHNLPPLPSPIADDFILFTAGDVLAFITFLKGGVIIFLGLTVITSIFVSGFVLANLFHISIAERQREIGLKKALGATHTDILAEFLWEALIICFMGAIGGLVMGILISKILERFELLTISLSGFLFGMAFLGAAGIGLVFAVRPAQMAAGLSPIKALKDEA